ncbi:MAG: LysR family transcriptional regulator [Rhodocyclaceae bacterium]|nr:LysR family transcriptional regulator [Rhodocyclaceae bacterium]MBX3669264.1 LysR family transcriptional regulator [Rhodocyclaceae bacterium]
MNDKPLLEDLRLFCAVLKQRSLAATARELGVSNAYVSKRLGLLEQSLRARLLHRTTRQVVATEHGDIVRAWAERILEDVDQMSAEVSQVALAPAGRLRICSSHGFGRRHLAPALSDFAAHHAGVEIQLELLDRPVDLLDEGYQLDIRVGAVHEPHLIARRLAPNYRVLCAAPAYLARRGAPARLSDLTEHDCIVIRERDQDFGRWALAGPEGLQYIKVHGRMSSNNGEIVRAWGLAGHGIMLRSLWDIAAPLARGELVRVLPQYAQAADIWAACPSRLSSSAKVRACVEFLQQRLAREPWASSAPDGDGKTD